MKEYILRIRIKVDDDLLKIIERDIPRYCEKHGITKHSIDVVKEAKNVLLIFRTYNKIEINIYSNNYTDHMKVSRDMQVFCLAKGW